MAIRPIFDDDDGLEDLREELSYLERTMVPYHDPMYSTRRREADELSGKIYSLKQIKSLAIFSAKNPYRYDDDDY